MRISDETETILVAEEDMDLYKKVYSILLVFGKTGDLSLATMSVKTLIAEYLNKIVRGQYIKNTDAVRILDKTICDMQDMMIDLGMSLFALACVETHTVGAYSLNKNVKPAAQELLKEFDVLFHEFDKDFQASHDKMMERIQKAMAESLSHCRKSLREENGNVSETA